MTRYYNGDTFEHNGRTYLLQIEPDSDHGAPWDEEDGHGPVSEWTTRSKAPGERVLHSDRRSFRYYDFAAAIMIAKRDGWDAKPYGVGTKGERAARAVEADFKHLQAWCNDQWCYNLVIVTALDSDGEKTDESGCLGGVDDSDGGTYLQGCARELADEIAARLDDAMAADIAESRPDMAAHT